ncbi:MAG TPA: kelch repeat-containing protein [Candidatus Limnocylindrales bacterium]|nr:kelch repeat-containing protein [Candidatus Limnocylindrales bacterium]
MVGRLVRMALVVLLGLAVGVGGYVAFLLLGNPAPREARGWALLATLPSARGETATAVSGERLYVIGGLSGLNSQPTAEVSAYDPVGNAWNDVAPLPAARDHAAAVGLNESVYVSGGGSAARKPQATFWVLEPGTATWKELPPMPEARFAHRVVALNKRLYVVGGIGQTGRVLIYDPVSEAWMSGAEMPAPRDHLAAVVVEGEIWAIGGRVSGRAQSRVDIYDPMADAWHPGPPLPVATSGAAEGVLDGFILVSGGEDPGGADRVRDQHWQLDTRVAGGGWVPLNGPPLPVHGAQGAVIDGRFVIAGGAARPGSLSRFAWSGLVQAYRPPG